MTVADGGVSGFGRAVAAALGVGGGDVASPDAGVAD